MLQSKRVNEPMSETELRILHLSEKLSKLEESVDSLLAKVDSAAVISIVIQRIERDLDAAHGDIRKIHDSRSEYQAKTSERISSVENEINKWKHLGIGAFAVITLFSGTSIGLITWYLQRIETTIVEVQRQLAIKESYPR